MASQRRWLAWGVGSVWALPLLLGIMAMADDPSAVKPAAYAPMADLVASMDSLLERLGEDLATADGYAAEQQKRVAMDANTVAALALVLGRHDQDHPRKASAGAIVEASAQLGEQAGQYVEARQQLDVLRKAIQGEGAKGDPPAWKPVADIQQLMRQVPIVNNSLRRGVTGRRFSREQEMEKNRQHATTLAAIAQASMFDTSYCEDEQAARRWAAICAELRDAAADVHSAIQKADQKLATKHLERIVTTCDACHAEFRD